MFFVFLYTSKMDHNINTTTALWSPSKARRWLALAAYPLVWAVNRPSAAWLAGAIYDLALRCNGIAINYEGQYGLTAAEERFLGRIAPQIKGGVVFDVGANVGAYRPHHHVARSPDRHG